MQTAGQDNGYQPKSWGYNAIRESLAGGTGQKVSLKLFNYFIYRIKDDNLKRDVYVLGYDV